MLTSTQQSATRPHVDLRLCEWRTERRVSTVKSFWFNRINVRFRNSKYLPRRSSCHRQVARVGFTHLYLFVWKHPGSEAPLWLLRSRYTASPPLAQLSTPSLQVTCWDTSQAILTLPSAWKWKKAATTKSPSKSKCFPPTTSSLSPITSWRPSLPIKQGGASPSANGQATSPSPITIRFW